MFRDRRTLRAAAVFALLLAAFLLSVIWNLAAGTTSIPPGDILRLLLSGSDGSAEASVIWKLRLPRLLAAAVLGGGLSVSGFLLQTFFRNPIAGPYVLGISSGAKLAVGVTMIWALRVFSGVPFWALMTASFAGSMAVTLLVLLFARRAESISALLVVGIMIGSICSAVTDLFITFADEADAVSLHAWSMGSFSAVSWTNLGLASAIVLAAVFAAFCLSKPIGAYQLGERYAQSMGVRVKALRAALIALSSLLSACVTALTGPISFVGVAVPHMARLLFGTAKPLVIIPGSFLLGGIFCMLCDLIARTAFAPAQLAISSVTAVFGAPVVIWLMLRRQRRRARD